MMTESRNGLLTSRRHLSCVCLLKAAPPPTGSIWGRRSTLLCSALLCSACITSALTGNHDGARSDTPEPPSAMAVFCARLRGFAPVQRGEERFCFAHWQHNPSLKRSSAQLPLALSVNLNLFLKLLHVNCLWNNKVNFNFNQAKNRFAIGVFFILTPPNSSTEVYMCLINVFNCCVSILLHWRIHLRLKHEI